ncbi:malto-oligosyltrehalose synthase [Amaricoccus solimangrovi]|uniref:Malto-oligosyltrehalose synthase n=2 Tax=Amaricoccus solimangrovi TaxID=2589815 RepID=A0A501WKK0_9RHOB|nr:malto-oligosyltrehalose synthase [Amaricoccus solimangrovi]
MQFGPGFGFADAARHAPYLARLGVSHVYCAPIFAARPGSTHGYDVIDPTRINPELGGEDGFRAMAADFRAAGLGLILDIVPNHMGVGTDNRYWQSVLREGPESPYAGWFDIDWNHPELPGKLLLPILGRCYGAALAAGDLAVKVDAEGPAVWAHETHRLPLRAEDVAALDDPAEVARLNADRGALDALIARQHWRVAKFDYDRGVINYRRFFTVSDLAGLRVELPEVFEATHRLILDLVAEGLVDGLRVDHVDGLYDPGDYCRRLRSAVSRPVRIWVEKILGADEPLPADWGTDGTTGYEFANLVDGLLVVPGALGALDDAYSGFVGRVPDVAGMVRAAKIEIMTGRMAGELDALLARIVDLARADPEARDIAPQILRAALVETVAALDVYRTYADAAGLSPADHARIDAALGRARARAPELGPEVFDFLAALLTLARPEGMPVLRRLQQLTGPVTAKGVEDTLLYRHARLIALNEVGCEPGRYAGTVAEFHAANAARARELPACLLTGSTHDTKRGEDARARIAAITQDPPAFARAASAWLGMLEDPARPIDRNEAWFFFQLLLGAWPMEWRPDRHPGVEELGAFRERVREAMLKSAREAAVNTRWVHGDPDYEAALAAFVDRALDAGPENRFLAAFRETEAALFPAGLGNALIQTALRLTAPGVPDIYRGAELWEQSLVDPDNRRPVDFSTREGMLDALDQGVGAPLLGGIEGGGPKLALIAALLAHRASAPDLYARGEYVPVAAADPRLLAFARRWNGTTLVTVARLPGTAVEPDLAALGLVGGWRDLVAPAISGDPSTAPFASAPVAVLVRP